MLLSIVIVIVLGLVGAESVVSATPGITTSTEVTCIRLYLLPTIQPRIILTISPPLLNMMWIDMGVRNANAALLSSEMR